ncbi:MAG TPA: hypothetical protein ENI13_00705 [candidate division CPR3 bacterium]|uniref:Uncharacterized protein n=1 Tax=candidate division CPR3 bacterium TaxID=2268181 RepID=A0A7C1T7D6_UNCC3|nr:hypothetical protein [candidate division CPR3 bacterium]
MKVIIVNEGEWGRAKRDAGDYNSFTEALVSLLERESPQGTSVESVDNTEEVLQGVTLNSASETVIIFTTRGMFRKAVEIKKNHRQIRVVVLTGLPDNLGDNSPVVVLGKVIPIGDTGEFVRTILGS